jgi:hypothetical protein
MPYKTNLELFGPVALAYLMDGPKPQPRFGIQGLKVVEIGAYSDSGTTSIQVLPRAKTAS